MLLDLLRSARSGSIYFRPSWRLRQVRSSSLFLFLPSASVRPSTRTALPDGFHPRWLRRSCPSDSFAVLPGGGGRKELYTEATEHANGRSPRRQIRVDRPWALGRVTASGSRLRPSSCPVAAPHNDPRATGPRSTLHQGRSPSHC